MAPSPAGTDMFPHLRTLNSVNQRSRLSNFTFNPITRQAEYNPSRARISRFIFQALRLYYGTVSFVQIALMVLQYTANQKQIYLLKSINAQEHYLWVAFAISAHLGYSMLAGSYLTHGCIIPRIINDLCKIFELLKTRTDGALFISAEFQVALLIKFVFILHQLAINLVSLPIILFLTLNILDPYVMILVGVTFFGHVYSQLTLICFFAKMHQLVESAPPEMTTTQFTDYICEVFLISHRINQVKRELDSFFSTLFITTYLGLFADINRLYTILKAMIFSPSFESGPPRFFEILWYVFQYVPPALAVSYDIFLIGRLSDMLIAAQRNFEQSIVMLILKRGLFQVDAIDRGANQFQLERVVWNLESFVCRVIKIDQKLAFDFYTNIVLIYVITCLQFYVSESISLAGVVSLQKLHVRS